MNLCTEKLQQKTVLLSICCRRWRWTRRCLTICSRSCGNKPAQAARKERKGRRRKSKRGWTMYPCFIGPPAGLQSSTIRPVHIQSLDPCQTTIVKYTHIQSPLLLNKQQRMLFWWQAPMGRKSEWNRWYGALGPPLCLLLCLPPIASILTPPLRSSVQRERRRIMGAVVLRSQGPRTSVWGGKKLHWG